MRHLVCDKVFPVQKYESVINQLCAPLFAETPISFFNFIKLYKNRAHILSSSSSPFTETVNNDLLNFGGAFNSTNNQHTSSKMWECMDLCRKGVAIQKIYENHDISNGILFSFEMDNYKVLIEFGAKPQTRKVYDTYMNKRNELVNYAFALIKNFYLLHPENETYLFPVNFDKKQIRHETARQTQLYSGVSQFINQSNLEELSLVSYLHLRGLNCLSVREKQCVLGIAFNKKVEAIASELGLKRRTVENYLENAKVKMNCQNRGELINIVVGNNENLLDLIID